MQADQAELSADDLAWLRGLSGELVLDCARPGDVYVCHGMPGNPFNTLWPTGPIYDANVTEAMKTAALSRSEPAGDDLILCGHIHTPYPRAIDLPNGRRPLVVRASGWPAQPDRARRTSVAIMEPGADEWQVAFHPVRYTPRDPTWRWN